MRNRELRKPNVTPPKSRNPVIADGRVRPVAVAALNRRTSAIVGAVGDGERLVVTRHGDPVAVVFSVRDAMEMHVAPELSLLAEEARREYEAREMFEPWAHVGPWRIVLGGAAADAYGRVGSVDRGGLRRALCRGEAACERPLWLPSGRWLTAFSYPDEGVVLVHALIRAHELERQVIGEEVWGARLRRNLDRHAHARTPWQRAARADSG
jgi:prevent-host-death family protein